MPSVFEYLCYAVGNTNLIATILFFFALADRPITRFMRIVAISSFASTAPLILVPLFPLKQAIAIRWFLDVSPQFFSLAISASCLSCLAPLFAFWPLKKIARNHDPHLPRLLVLDAHQSSLHGNAVPRPAACSLGLSQAPAHSLCRHGRCRQLP